MGYTLGVDLGTTFTAAAVLSGNWPAMVGLGNRAMQVPSVLVLTPDGEFLVGEAAERRSVEYPERTTREFKRRLGDGTPVLLGSTPQSPQELMSKMLGWVVDVVSERQGEPPEHVTLTHPASWGPYKRELFDQAIRLADLDDARTCSEPEAVAILYASRHVLQDGEAILVYDLGGGTFDAAVVRKTASGFEILGKPEGIEHLGGVDLDEAVFQHVLSSVQAGVDQLDTTGELLASLARLRRDCVEAKEALSSDTAVAVPVNLPGLTATVRLNRSEFEDMVRPTIVDTVAASRRALRSAKLEPDALAAIVLSGGSSRLPLVSHLLQEVFDRPIAIDTHPKHDVAQGATLWRPGEDPRFSVSVPLELPKARQSSGPQPRPVPTRPPADNAASPRPRQQLAGTPARVGQQVTGVLCLNDHFNDPRALVCAVCGLDVVEQSLVLLNDVRPSLGRLAVEDAKSTFELTADYLIGRSPDSDGWVKSGQYKAIELNDDLNMVSRVHARIELRNWDVVLVDNASTNGTFFIEPGSPHWKRLPRGGGRILLPGCRVRVGRRTLLYERRLH